MPKRSSRPRGPDVVQDAGRVVDIPAPEPMALERAPVSKTIVAQVMAEMGRKGGRIGGKRRLETLTPEERTQIASDAARARWAKSKAKRKTRAS